MEKNFFAFAFQSGLCSSSELSTSRGSVRIQHLTSAASIMKESGGRGGGVETDGDAADGGGRVDLDDGRVRKVIEEILQDFSAICTI